MASYAHAVVFPLKLGFLRVDVRPGRGPERAYSLSLRECIMHRSLYPYGTSSLFFYLLLVTALTDNEQTTIAEYGARGLSQHDCQSLTR